MVEDGGHLPEEDPFPQEMEPPELLMEATVRVLATEGIDGVTLRKVADTAEMNRGLVHYYFDSKADLLSSLLDHVLAGTKELIGIDDSDPPTQKLWDALQFHAYGPGGIDSAGRHYYQAILQLQALSAHNDDVRRQFARNHRYMVDTVKTIIEEGISDGEFRPVDPDETASFLVTAIDGARNLDMAIRGTAARETSLRTLEAFMAEFVVE